MEQKLETFLTLCRTMHYGRAAEALNLSQPAVSKHIQALETEYGAPLFSYANRRLSKTPQGELLERYAISILLPEIYRYLSRPENELLFLVDNTAHLLAQLEAGELDFVVLEGVFNKERYDSFLLRPEPYIGICSARHPLAGRRASIEELFDQRLILREEGSGTRRILEYELAQQGYRITSFPHRACVSSFKLIKELVRSGYGISFLYEAVVKNDPSFGRFFCPPLTGMHDLNVVFLQNTDAGRLARQFLAR